MALDERYDSPLEQLFKSLSATALPLVQQAYEYAFQTRANYDLYSGYDPSVSAYIDHANLQYRLLSSETDIALLLTKIVQPPDPKALALCFLMDELRKGHSSHADMTAAFGSDIADSVQHLTLPFQEGGRQYDAERYQPLFDADESTRLCYSVFGLWLYPTLCAPEYREDWEQSWYEELEKGTLPIARTTNVYITEELTHILEKARGFLSNPS